MSPPQRHSVARAGELIQVPAHAIAIATGQFTGRLAIGHARVPAWSCGVQLAAVQFFRPIGGRRAPTSVARAQPPRDQAAAL